jgi:hypothetical protein
MSDNGHLDFAEVLATCTRTLLSAYAPVEQVDAFGGGPSDFVLALISFTGRQVRGTLVLDASRELLARSYALAVPGVEPDEADLADWSAELANLLLGQIKCKLQSLGMTIQLSTPVVVEGEDLRARATMRPIERVAQRFEGEDARAWARVRLEVMADPCHACDSVRPRLSVMAPKGGDMFVFD